MAGAEEEALSPCCLPATELAGRVLSHSGHVSIRKTLVSAPRYAPHPLCDPEQVICPIFPLSLILDDEGYNTSPAGRIK